MDVPKEATEIINKPSHDIFHYRHLTASKSCILLASVYCGSLVRDGYKPLQPELSSYQSEQS